ncbi:transcription factor MYB124-like isoform X2 [Andrographis paniculata]|uniref:transcription factor MYB124-like isoform X2 n=1 Tax=Andrographis paniculata TaxID=175694 RepID=UPI0021E8AF24|nr:transcription factor MYB124-like isoform X2 [Andrographis paniculata]
MKHKVDKNSDIDSSNTQEQKHKERRIVSWSQEEDDILRKQIREHGTHNWVIIASKFNDKTTRQCRRRWFTYLNSDFKKGGWSPEEDKLLCEAQKIYGNRWTEIAKVVSGRTDNAVKNRFTTLCKKRAKREPLAEQNNTESYIHLNNKRVLSHNGYIADWSPKSDEPIKRIRLSFSVESEAKFPTQLPVEAPCDGSMENLPGQSFLEKDDPKVLSSVAVEVNEEKTDLSLENEQMVRGDYLRGNKESESAVYESSPTSSELSTGSTLISKTPGSKTEEHQHSQLDQYDHQASDLKGNEGASYTEFTSPLQVTPLFRAFAAAIPSPQFSESEKHFLMKTLGMDSPPISPIMNASHPPPCKRSLLHCL